MKKLKGKITISRPSYSTGEEYVEINVEDNNSHCNFLKIKFTYEEFTKALMGQAMIPILMEASHLDKVGLIRETKPLVFQCQNMWVLKIMQNKMQKNLLIMVG